MNCENLQKLIDRIKMDPSLLERVRQIDRSSYESTALGLSRLSVELGFPFPPSLLLKGLPKRLRRSPSTPSL